MFGGCGQAELSADSLFFKFICGIHLVPETKNATTTMDGQRHWKGLCLRCKGSAPDAACAGNRPHHSDRKPAGQLQRGLPETGVAGIMVGAEETTRHRVMSKTGGREQSRPPFAFQESGKRTEKAEKTRSTQNGF